MNRGYSQVFAQVYDEHWDLLGSEDVHAAIYVALDRLSLDEDHRPHWLDLFCGGGHLLQEVQRHQPEMNWQLTGIDASAPQCRMARRRVPDAKIIHGDATKHRTTQLYDVVSCLGGSINEIHDRRELQRVLRRWIKRVRHGGLMIFDANTPDGMAHNAGRMIACEKGDHPFWLTWRYLPKRQMIEWHFTAMVRTEDALFRRHHWTHHQRGYALSDIEPLLQEMGLKYQVLDTTTLDVPDTLSAALLYIVEA